LKINTQHEPVSHPVLIIGGGLAGAACTIALRRAGVDVLALDRDQFPRRKVCGGFLSPGAIQCLDDLGLLPQVRSEGAVAVRRARVRLGDREIDIPFDEPALGISRERLDQILAEAARVRSGHFVEHVEPLKKGFRVHVTASDGRSLRLDAAIVIDAAGKLSRFTGRRTRPQYGVQYYEDRPTDSTLEFRFFEGGYGGSVSVEGGRTNTCFLVDKTRVGAYRDRDGCMVTGSVGYTRTRGQYLAIGDAGGMIDPFCGEGIRHALESGRTAGEIVSEGMDRGLSYAAIRESYERGHEQAWRRKRALGSILRWVLGHRLPKSTAFAIGGQFPGVGRKLLDQLWK
jgi:flavin-dependent dehydrogenase